AIHPGVYFQMDSYALADARGQLPELPHRGGMAHAAGQAMRDTPGQFCFLSVAQQQQWRRNPLAAQSDGLVQGRQSKKSRAAFDRHPRDLKSTVSISVILDDRKQLQGGRLVLVDDLKIAL